MTFLQCHNSEVLTRREGYQASDECISTFAGVNGENTTPVDIFKENLVLFAAMFVST